MGGDSKQKGNADRKCTRNGSDFSFLFYEVFSTQLLGLSSLTIIIIFLLCLDKIVEIFFMFSKYIY